MKLKFNGISLLYIPESPLLMDATSSAKIQVRPRRLRVRLVNDDNGTGQALFR